MTLPSLNDGERARASFVDFRLQLQRRIQPSARAPLTHQEIQQETSFDADLVAQLPVLRRYAHKLTHDDRDAKKKTKWQKFAVTLATDVRNISASIRMKDTTAPSGTTDSTRSGVATNRTTSLVSGSGEVTRTDRPRISGIKRLSHAHQVQRVRPSTSKR